MLSDLTNPATRRRLAPLWARLVIGTAAGAAAGFLLGAWPTRREPNSMRAAAFFFAVGGAASLVADLERGRLRPLVASAVGATYAAGLFAFLPAEWLVFWPLLSAPAGRFVRDRLDPERRPLGPSVAFVYAMTLGVFALAVLIPFLSRMDAPQRYGAWVGFVATMGQTLQAAVVPPEPRPPS